MKLTGGTKKMAFFILLMASIGMALIGCGGGSNSGGPGGGRAIMNPCDGGQGTGVVYCGGYYIDKDSRKPCYWASNGTQQNNLDANGLASADVNGICFYDGKVYCIGNDYTGNGNDIARHDFAGESGVINAIFVD